MYLSTQEQVLTSLLDCGTSDLNMLDNVCSYLGEDCYDVEEVVKSGDLNAVLYESYSAITSKVYDKALERINDMENDTESEINCIEEDNAQCTKEDEKVDYVEICDFNIPIDDVNTLFDHLKQKAIDLDENYPFCNCLDTYFQNDLDNYVDWEKDAEDNAEIPNQRMGQRVGRTKRLNQPHSY